MLDLSTQLRDRFGYVAYEFFPNGTETPERRPLRMQDVIGLAMADKPAPNESPSLLFGIWDKIQKGQALTIPEFATVRKRVEGLHDKMPPIMVGQALAILDIAAGDSVIELGFGDGA